MNKEQHALLNMLHQRYYLHILLYIRSRVNKLDIAEDLTSLTFERALTHIAELQTPETVVAWLYRIARNCTHDYFRSQRSEISLEALAVAQRPRILSPEEHVIADEERRILLAHISSLGKREQEIIGLKFVGHLTNRQIAHLLNMPEGTVGSLLYRTLGKLRDALRTEGST